MKVVYKFFIIFLFIIAIISKQTITYADISIQNLLTVPDKAVSTQEKVNELFVNSAGLKENSKSLYRVLFIIGMVAILVVGGYLGIKFIMASVEEKAQIKEMLIPYIVGSVVIFGAYTIWSLVVNILGETISY